MCHPLQVRDVTAYFVTCAVTLRLLWDAQFSAKEAALLIVMYVAYILLCIYTSRCVAYSHPRAHASANGTGLPPSVILLYRILYEKVW